MNKELGRVAGIDFGTVRVGIAISDYGRIIASPLDTYVRRSEPQDAAFFKRLIENEQIVRFVLGLPVHLDGGIGEKAEEAIAFGKWLHDVTGLEVDFIDERFSSVEADTYMNFANLSRKKRKNSRDRIAAQILLTTYLETGCVSNRNPGAID